MKELRKQTRKELRKNLSESAPGCTAWQRLKAELDSRAHPATIWIAAATVVTALASLFGWLFPIN